MTDEELFEESIDFMQELRQSPCILDYDIVDTILNNKKRYDLIKNRKKYLELLINEKIKCEKEL